MFVLKLNPTGKLVYSTLVPGNSPPVPGTAYANNFVTWGIHVDAKGQVTVTGLAGLGLPTTPGVLEASVPVPLNAIDPTSGFMLQLNADATAINFATYLPGTDTSNGLAVDPNGNFYVTGSTSQSNLPVSANAFQKTISAGPSCECNDGYILKIDPQGKKVLAGTYLGGTPVLGNEGTSFMSIALDSKSNVLVGGVTASADFPLKNPVVSQLRTSTTAWGLVAAEMNPDLSSLLFGSFLSSTSFQGGSQFATIAVDAQDHVIVAGESIAADFPTTAGSFQTAPPPASNPLVGYQHGFVSKLDLTTPAPSICLASDSIDFGSILVNASTSQTLTLTNCGNAPLQISSVTPSLLIVTATQSCGSVAPGATCDVHFTFTPTTTDPVSGTITLSDNAAIPQQIIPFSGKGGTPQILFPPTIYVNDLLVGTSAEYSFLFTNSGDGAWLISNVSITGDFSLHNQCPILGSFSEPQSADRHPASQLLHNRNHLRSDRGWTAHWNSNDHG